ncbi:hypothetical protein BGX27_010839 [Mortierella sp. AM989]|nr:hypothetical protein BGX27_010839 [Mortierella sp. AM989]
MKEQLPPSLVQDHSLAQAQTVPKTHSLIVVNGADDRDAGIYSDNFYSQRMSPLRSALRRRMLPWVRNETKDLAALQERWRTPFLDNYFTLTAFAGHPLFFVCILPIMFWYGHSVFARGFVNVACIGVFVTSWVKDYLCLPRPLSPPLIRLSRSKRGWSIAAKILATCGLAVYLFSVVFGRLYCGMHTKTDILGGTVIGVIVWAVQWIFRDSIDALMTESSWKGIEFNPSFDQDMHVTTLAVIMGIFPASQHFALSKTYGGNLRRQPIGRVPSVMDISALADSSIEIIGPQSTMDIHEQFSQTRSSRRSSVHSLVSDFNIETKEHFGLRPNHTSKARQEQRDQEENKAAPLESLDGDNLNPERELDESERIAMEKFEAEHPGWARFDVDIVIKTVVYAGPQHLQQQQLQVPSVQHPPSRTANMANANSNPRHRRNSSSMSSSAYRYHYHQHQGINEGGPSPTSSTSSASSKRHSYMQIDNAGITVEEYEDILSSEVWIEVPKLREYARHGIPNEVRGVHRHSDRSKEVSTEKQRRIEFEQLDKEPNESSKRVRSEISRYLRKVKIESSRDIPRLFEEYISTFCNQNHQVEYYPAMVNLCAPFVYAVKCEWAAYMCFERTINILNDHFREQSVNEVVAKFMTLFHTCIPDLYSYFEEEEVDIKEWAASALQYLLSRELPLECTMRLWDTYFAIPNAGWIGLHPYACLAILKHLKEGFEDLEQSEIRTVLMKLPHLDMDRYLFSISAPHVSVITTCTAPGTIALTFDDDLQSFTNELLDLMQARSTKVIFFMNGHNNGDIGTFAAVVKRAYDEGHQIASHTWDHADLRTLSKNAIIREMTTLNDLDTNTIAGLGYKTVIWDKVPKGWTDLDIPDENFKPDHIYFNHDIQGNTALHIALQAVDIALDKKYRA